MTIKDITDDIIIDPWLPIPCEVLQSMDTKGVKCYQEIMQKIINEKNVSLVCKLFPVSCKIKTRFLKGAQTYL